MRTIKNKGPPVIGSSKHPLPNDGTAQSTSTAFSINSAVGSKSEIVQNNIKTYYLMEQDIVSNAVVNIMTVPDLQKIKNKEMWTSGKKFLSSLVTAVPYVGGIVEEGYYNTMSYKDSEFFRKFAYFVGNIDGSYSEKDREKFLQDIEEKSQDYSGNVIMNMVDRLDSIHKGRIAANLINAKMSGQISVDVYFRLESLLERIPYFDLQELPKYEHDYYDDNGDTELLYATGALRMSTLDAQEGGVNKYVLSPLGCKLLRYGLGINVNVEHKTGTNVALNVVTNEDIEAMFESKKEEIIKEARPNYTVVGETRAFDPESIVRNGL